VSVSLPTLRDVAALAGVHPATASRALNPATKGMTSAGTAKRVMRAAEQLGYRPNTVARSLRTARSSSIGVVVPDLTNPLFPPIVRGIEAALAPHGYVLLIVNTDNNLGQEAQLVESLQARSIDGLILATARLQHPLIEKLAATELPVVLVNRRRPGLPLPCVVPDDAAGIRLAVAHLAELGHHRIAHVAGPQNTSTGLTRLRAFRAAIRDHGLDRDPALIGMCGSWSEAEGMRAFSELIDADTSFSAVIAGNDMLAVGCYDALRDRGLNCPDDLSVVGFNDMPFVDKLQPALTTVHIPHHDLGAEAARLLLDQMSSFRRQERTVLLPVVLAERRSTGPPGRTARSRTARPRAAQPKVGQPRAADLGQTVSLGLRSTEPSVTVKVSQGAGRAPR
jgi:LacI family transcriptional regulator